jgi:hypothetical protein
MGLLYDTLIAAMLAAIFAIIVLHNRADSAENSARELAREDVRRFQQEITLQTALAKVKHDERGYPPTIETSWFNGQLPKNPLISPDHPWLEIAGTDQKDLDHPVERIAAEKSVASFWYNPCTGILRARVPAGISDSAALDLYNYINDCNLPELFATAERE